MTKRHCCERMKYELDKRCDEHESPYDCPDNLIIYSERFDEYGIIIHDGGASKIVIGFCPWCGEELPSRRKEWFRRLEQLGFDDPFMQDIPEAFRSGAWYRDGDEDAICGPGLQAVWTLTGIESS